MGNIVDCYLVVSEVTDPVHFAPNDTGHTVTLDTTRVIIQMVISRVL